MMDRGVASTYERQIARKAHEALRVGNDGTES
jgi:hypothetical protein